MTDHPSLDLATFAAQLRFDVIPSHVVERAVNLYVDWLGSALAGKGARPVETIAAFARRAALGGGTDEGGAAEVLIDRTHSTPYFAAMVNGAASHFAEQDDVHNGSVFHPATVVFPVALALAQARGASGRDLITAAIAGYETGIRVGEFLADLITKCSIRRALPGRWRRRPRQADCLACRRNRCWMRSVRPAHRLVAYGSSCATPPIRNNFIQQWRPPMV